MLAYSRAGLQIPGCERHVCGGGEEVGGIAGPAEGEDGGFVARQLAVVLAGAVGPPEQDAAVHAA